jgi:hypothetical protein
MSSTESWKDKFFISVRFPVLAHQH